MERIHGINEDHGRPFPFPQLARSHTAGAVYLFDIMHEAFSL